MGDPAGIGPELTMRAWAQLRQSGPVWFAITAMEPASRQARALGLPPPVAIHAPEEAKDVFAKALPVLPLDLPAPVTPGVPNTANAPAVIAAIEQAAHYAMSGEAGAMVTNPIAKAVLYEAGFAHPGHTEFLGALATQAPSWPQPRGPVMLLQGGGLRVALVTVHLRLRDVPAAITRERIMGAARGFDGALKRGFGLARPRLALCALNPHAGEDGAMGDEEVQIINPAAQALRDEGIAISAARPADTLFGEEARAGYDAALAMYHDQGLIPVKTLDFDGGVNITLGLPFIRTSPDHGTGFDIAGKGLARPGSLIAALRTAAAMAAKRQAHDSA